MSVAENVIDATAAFECARVGHEPMFRLTPNVFVSSWISTCSRCGRVAEFTHDGSPGAEEPVAMPPHKEMRS